MSVDKFNEKLLISTCNKIKGLVNTEPYRSMIPATKYAEVFPLYQEFAIAHPVVFKTIIYDNKFTQKAFNKYMRLYRNTQISPENHTKLGGKYMMFLAEAESERTGSHVSRQKLTQYGQECEDIMTKDLERLKNIEKEEREKYKKNEEERLENNRKELLEYFQSLQEESITFS